MDAGTTASSPAPVAAPPPASKEGASPPNDGAPQPKEADWARELQAFLDSSRGQAVVEKSLVALAVREKLDEAVQGYLRTRVYPGIAVAAAVLAFFGVGFERQVQAARESVEAQVKAVSDQKQQLQAELQAMREAALVARHDLKQLQMEARLNQVEMRGEITRQRGEVAQSVHESKEWTAESRRRIEVESQELANLRSRVREADLRMASTDGKLGELVGRVEKGTEAAQRLRTLADFQGRVIGAAVIEYLTLRSNTRSNVVDLPKEDHGSYRLQFETPNIQERFLLTYRVNGQEQKIEVSNQDKWNWYPLVGTDGRYEFRVDHVFHGPGSKIPDYVALRVRGLGTLTPREARVAEGGR